MANSRGQVRDLNDDIRHHLLAHGHLGPQALTIDTAEGTREYRARDLVVVTHNDHRRHLLNGQTGTVTEVTAVGLTVRLQDGRQVELER